MSSAGAARKDGPGGPVDEAWQSLRAIANEPIRAAFVRRALDEVLVLAERDEAALLDALARPGSVLGASAADVDTRWAALKAEGRMAAQAWLAAEGGTIGPEQVAQRLALTRQAVHNRMRRGRLIAVPGDHGARYPVWQFADGGMLAGIEPVIAVLVGIEPALVVQFFLSGRSTLGGDRPIDALRAGRADAVLAAAIDFTAEG